MTESRSLRQWHGFAQLTKVDETQRIVEGVFAEEAPDHSKEIFDYETSKPNFEDWSRSMQKRSKGKSLGNVREMHRLSAVGKVLKLNFDDSAKRITGVVKITDDAAWEKIVEGVYTGFSIGGSYADHWRDGLYKRYTAAPTEISVVDNPCQEGASFELIRADGTKELRKLIGRAKDDTLAKHDWPVARLADIAEELYQRAEMLEVEHPDVADALNGLRKEVLGLVERGAAAEAAEVDDEDDDGDDDNEGEDTDMGKAKETPTADAKLYDELDGLRKKEPELKKASSGSDGLHADHHQAMAAVHAKLSEHHAKMAEKFGAEQDDGDDGKDGDDGDDGKDGEDGDGKAARGDLRKYVRAEDIGAIVEKAVAKAVKEAIKDTDQAVGTIGQELVKLLREPEHPRAAVNGKAATLSKAADGGNGDGKDELGLTADEAKDPVQVIKAIQRGGLARVR